jgi:abortive infection bacteriophage resistance protein
VDFGGTHSFYRKVEPPIRKHVALSCNQPEEVVLSWLLGLNTIRNRYAHHSLLWNWQLGIPIKLPNTRKNKEWNIPELCNRQLGSILYICAWMSDTLIMKDYWRGRAINFLMDFEDLNAFQESFQHIILQHQLGRDPLFFGNVFDDSLELHRILHSNTSR